MLTAGLSNKALIKRQAAESSGHRPEGIRQPKGVNPTVWLWTSQQAEMTWTAYNENCMNNLRIPVPQE
jgi:hypothetical protein